MRSELRARSQLLNKELLDLVNANYTDFLSLGSSLKSGDERVEEIRVGLLGFRKEVDSVRATVLEKEEEVRKAVEEKKQFREKIVLGRRLVGWDARLGVLEGELMVGSAAKGTTQDDSESEDEDSDDDEDGTYTVSMSKLRRTVEQYRILQQAANAIGEGHPFIAAQSHRMAKVRSTLLLDLKAALQQARQAGPSGADRIMKIMKIYADMDESSEAVNILKSSKTA